MMGKWKVGAITGAVWGLISLVTLSGGIWLNPLIKYTFGLPTTLTFHIVNWLNFIIVPIIGIWFSYIVLFLLAPTIGAIIVVGIVYLTGKVRAKQKIIKF